jgi:hypothetical protein
MYRFSEFLADKGYSQEQSVLLQLPKLDMVQQAQLDMKLHNDAIVNRTFGSQSQQLATDKGWKQRFIDIIQGKETNPEIIRQTIDNIEVDLESHRNRLSDRRTGSSAWHQAWIAVYEQWLQKLHQLSRSI